MYLYKKKLYTDRYLKLKTRITYKKMDVCVIDIKKKLPHTQSLYEL